MHHARVSLEGYIGWIYHSLQPLNSEGTKHDRNQRVTVPMALKNSNILVDTTDRALGEVELDRRRKKHKVKIRLTPLKQNDPVE